MANYTKDVDNVFLFIGGIGFLLLLLITFLMLLFVFKYRKEKHKHAKDVKDNIVLEIIWTVIPTIIVLAMFYYGFIVFKKMRYVPPDAYKIKVIGKRWSWSFEYENGFKSDTLFLAVKKPFKLEMKSTDVVHSLYIPAYRIKEDLLPGYETYISITPVDTGTFDLFCAEYCGDLHAFMKTKVKVLEQDEFYTILQKNVEKTREELLKTKKKETIEKKETQTTLIKMGEKIMEEEGCFACHSTDLSENIAPSFKNMYGKKRIVIEKGKEKEITINYEYIKESILYPDKKVVKGYENLMPEYELSEEDIEKIVEYIKSLK